MAEAHDAATLAWYDAQAAAYAVRRSGGTRPELAAFLARLAPGARVLELGCGGGQDAAAMLAAGFDVDATDGSAALAAEAERRLGRPVRVMRFDQLGAVRAYDAVWAAACLLHVPCAALPDVLGRIWRALKPGGVHAASFKASGREGRDRLGRLYNQVTAEALLPIYEGAGTWEVLAVQEWRGIGYDGEETPWVGVMLRKSADGPTPE